MIKILRKRHLQIWLLWAVLLPVGIVAAWVAVPKKAEQDLLQPPASKTVTLQIITTDTLNSK